MEALYIVWNPNPILLDLGFWAIRWYGLLFASGFAFGYFIMARIFKQEGKPEADMDSLTLHMVLGTVIGMRLGHCLFYQPDYYLAHPLEILFVWKGGYASHGAAIAIPIALWFYARAHAATQQTFLWILDRICYVTALAAVMIRLANFANSEIVGEPTDVPWAMIFPEVDMQPRHPTQLYEAAWYLLSFFILGRVYRRYRERTPQGILFGAFLLLVFGFRFVIEFLKKEQVPFEVGMPLNMGQILSIPFVLIGLYFFARGVRQLPQRIGSTL
jgi:phosphatidylglycerol:prolipoprotein diacylglycerol transferase